MELLHRKRGEQDQRPQPAPTRNQGHLYPPFQANPGPSGFGPPSTAPKNSPATHMPEPYPYSTGQHIFPESTEMPLSEGSAFGPVTIGPNPGGLYAFAPPSGNFPPPPDGQPTNMFGWWSGNESWREYAQSISTMAGELDPTETYSASALIALNRDCDSSMHPNLHNGTPSAAGIGLNTVTPAANPGPPISTARNNSYPATETTGGPWPIMTGSYGYADSSALRGVSGDTGGNGP